MITVLLRDDRVISGYDFSYTVFLISLAGHPENRKERFLPDAFSFCTQRDPHWHLHELSEDPSFWTPSCIALRTLRVL